MNHTKLQNVLSAMEKQGVSQLIVSDPAVIFYLTGARIEPGERMLALLLQNDGDHRVVINDLFRQTRELGAPITYYNDTQDGVAILAASLTAGKTTAIDKNWPARFLLRLQELFDGRCVNSSPIIDGVRAIKTAEEQEKMRVSSRINDAVMERLIACLGQNHTEKELGAILLKLYLDEG